MHATEMKTKRHYTAPVTQRATLELEGGFCGSIYKEKDVKVMGHEVGNEYSFSIGFGGENNNDLVGKETGGGSITWE